MSTKAGPKKDAVPTTDASGSTNKKPSAKTAIEDIYQKKTQLEHILLRPDTYIGKS
jgi:DNA topoisomerase-2